MRSRTIALSIPFLLLACGERAQTPGSAGTGGAGGGAGGTGGSGGSGGSAGTGGASTATIPAEPCNPLGYADCLLPFPSLAFEKDDAQSPTGVRLDLKGTQLPRSTDGPMIDPARWNLADGFSPAVFSAMLFPSQVDPANLPTQSAPEKSLQPDSPTALLELPSGKRVLHFAEVDLNTRDLSRQALLIRPLVRLKEKTRYAIVIRKSLKAKGGGELPPSPGFKAIADGTMTTNATLERLRAGYPALFTAAQTAGIAKDDILLAWEYVTASDAWIQTPVKSMRDQALSMIGASGENVTYRITSMERGAPGNGWKYFIKGKFKTPLYLTAGGAAEGVFMPDAQGRPQQQGMYEASFTLAVPNAADMAPQPLMIYGHGILGASDDDGTVAYMKTLCGEQGYVMLATDWSGLTGGDYGTIVGALAEFSNSTRITDKLQQSIVNAIVLSKLGRGPLVAEPLLQGNGHSAIDPSRILFHGNSLGGIMGTSFLAWSDVDHGAMNVAGGNWSLLIERSTQWSRLSIVLTGSYPDHVDQQKLLVLLQQQFDHSDPINTPPLYAAAPQKRVLLQEALDDALVNNLGTEMLARSLGLKVLMPSVKLPSGVEMTTAPADQGLTLWDLGVSPKPPMGNLLNDQDNAAHGGLRGKPAVRRQIKEFLLPAGRVTDQCGGMPCDCTMGRCS